MRLLDLYPNDKQFIYQQALELDMEASYESPRRNWHYRAIFPNYYDVIYANPKTESEKIQTLEILSFFKPHYLFIYGENTNYFEAIANDQDAQRKKLMQLFIQNLVVKFENT